MSERLKNRTIYGKIVLIMRWYNNKLHKLRVFLSISMINTKKYVTHYVSTLLVRFIVNNKVLLILSYLSLRFIRYSLTLSLLSLIFTQFPSYLLIILLLMILLEALLVLLFSFLFNTSSYLIYVYYLFASEAVMLKLELKLKL